MKKNPLSSYAISSVAVILIATCLLAVTPRLSAEITLVSRLSDARAYAMGNHLEDSPPPQVQTDFLPAQLSNSAKAHPVEGGVASSYCTSNSSIMVDDAMGSLRITGDGSVYAEALAIAEAEAGAKIIVVGFTLTERADSYSITGQLSSDVPCAPPHVCGAAMAKLVSGDSIIFEVTAAPKAMISESGTLPPGNYTLSVEISAHTFGGNFPGNQSSSSANFNFALDPGPTPTPAPLANITGNIAGCANPTPVPLPNVALTLTGTSSASTLSDGAGNYTFSALATGGSYTITPAKASLPPAGAGITAADVIGIQRHYLGLTLLSGCRLMAADVNQDGMVNAQDLIAVQRFYLGLTTGIANVGKYQFSPANRSYPALTSDQNNQDYDAVIFGDVATPFVGQEVGYR